MPPKLKTSVKKSKKPTKKVKQVWVVYILRCGDDSLYTGITNNLENRLNAHASGKGAKYTNGRGPFKLLHTEKFKNRSKASKRESEIKSLDRATKLKLISPS